MFNFDCVNFFSTNNCKDKMFSGTSKSELSFSFFSVIFWFDHFNLQFFFIYPPIRKVQISNLSRIGFFSFPSSSPIDPILFPWLRSDTTISMPNWWVHHLFFRFPFVFFFSLNLFRFRWCSRPVLFTRFFSGTWVLGNPASFCALSRVNFSNFRLFFYPFIWFRSSDWEILRILLGLLCMMKILPEFHVFSSQTCV